MILYLYDKTFDGLLSCVFFAYEQKRFPDAILSESDQKPLFVDEQYYITTEKEKSQRVWAALEKKLSKIAQNMMFRVWLSELPETEMLLFRYICKNIDHSQRYEMNFGDEDVLRIKRIAMKIGGEAERLRMFVRFQETADGIYFAPVEPQYNVLSLIVPHFKARYANQQWIIYDTNRNFGLFYDTNTVQEISHAGVVLQTVRYCLNRDFYKIRRLARFISVNLFLLLGKCVPLHYNLEIQQQCTNLFT